MGRRRSRKRLPEGEFSAAIESLSHDGRGVSHIDGKATFIHGALPGEQVLFTYSHVSRKHDEGIVSRVMEASEDRAEPVCEHFGICGGCSLQHLRYDVQLKFKQNYVMECLQRIGGFKKIKVLQTRGMKFPYNYRNKVQYPVAGG